MMFEIIGYWTGIVYHWVMFFTGFLLPPRRAEVVNLADYRSLRAAGS